MNSVEIIEKTAPPATATAIPANKDVSIFVAPEWKLVWWKFRKHKVALVSGIIIMLIYLVAVLVEFLAPFSSIATNSKYLYAPPQPLQFDGGLYVSGYTSVVDKASLRRVFVVDPTQKIQVGFFVEGVPYKLFGLLPGNRHLFGPVDATQ